MYEIREDFLTGQMVLMAMGRNDRPNFYKQVKLMALGGELCPFCIENNHMMPDVILSEDNERIRIVANKYPAIEFPLGVHEVVVDTDKHFEKFKDFSTEDIGHVFQVFQKRVGQIKNDKSIKYVQIFKNDGPNSGASISHSHWQIVGLPFVPDKQETMACNFFRYFEEHRHSYICSIYDEKQFVVYENQWVFAYVPVASSYAYNINIATKRHESDFMLLEYNEIQGLAKGIKAILSVLGQLFGDISYNICFQLAPFEFTGGFHFFIEVIPRLGNVAGFELGSRVAINSYFPEDIAPVLSRMLKE